MKGGFIKKCSTGSTGTTRCSVGGSRGECELWNDTWINAVQLLYNVLLESMPRKYKNSYITSLNKTKPNKTIQTISLFRKSHFSVKHDEQCRFQERVIHSGLYWCWQSFSYFFYICPSFTCSSWWFTGWHWPFKWLSVPSSWLSLESQHWETKTKPVNVCGVSRSRDTLLLLVWSLMYSNVWNKGSF